MSESVLLFDRNVDCFAVQGVLFILDKKRFKVTFRFIEFVAEEAQKSLGQIRAQLGITGFEEFARACERDMRKMAMLNRIAGRDYFRTLTPDKIKAIVEKCPALASTLAIVGGKPRVVYDPANSWALLRILDDGYLGSDMIGINYEVDSKRRVRS